MNSRRSSTHRGHLLPPPPPPPPQSQLQEYPRQTGLTYHQHHQQQQHGSQSPHQSHTLRAAAPPPGPYPSSHSTTDNIPQQSPYVVSGLGISQHQQQQHHPGETASWGAQLCSYSNDSVIGSYTLSESGDNLAAQTALNRQSYPPTSNYYTTSSDSPSSIHSPQTDIHGRPLYSMPSMAQHMYFPTQYQMPAQHRQQQPQQQQHTQDPLPPHQQQAQHNSAYAAHNHASNHHSAISSPPGMLMAHTQPILPPQAHTPLRHQQSRPSVHSQQSLIDSKGSTGALHRPSATSRGTQNTTSAPAPGPIPATTPLVVRQDSSGVQWISFEYSRDRVKMEYQIRCDVESVNVDELSHDFKSTNCVYPRACCEKNEYKGNRLNYETECNAVGWALAKLNPALRDKRGLIQRAVDSWRNSNQDLRLRSRRVRRQTKANSRKSSQQALSGTASHVPGWQETTYAGLQDSQASRDGIGLMAHHHQPPMQGQGGGRVELGTRCAQNFCSPRPSVPSRSGASIPSIYDDWSLVHGSPSTLAAAASSTKIPKDFIDRNVKRDLFGDVSENKRRRLTLVNDNEDQRDTRVRLHAMLDRVMLDDIPDAHLRLSAVYPRSYYPRHTRTSFDSPRVHNQWDDEDDVTPDLAACAEPGKTLVPVSLVDGTEAKLAVPRMTRSKRAKEVALNELGYRMSWSQPRTFNGRTLFLHRSLDKYRQNLRSTVLNAGEDVSRIAAHFETRPGKRKWLDHSKRMLRYKDSP